MTKNINVECFPGSRQKGHPRFLFCIVLSFCVLLCAVPQTQANDPYIWINVSLKVIVNPATGNTPATMDDETLRQSFADANRWLANTWRGYRIRLVDLDANQNFKRIGGLHDNIGPSKWYWTNLKGGDFGGPSDQANLQFEIDAKSNITLYGWNDTALNIYMNNGAYSSAQFPSSGRDLIVTAYSLLTVEANPPGQPFAPSYIVAGNLLHEIGHAFELYHTFPDDGILDTAPDPDMASHVDSVVLDAIANHNYNQSYVSLTTEQQTLVYNTAHNAMSYYQLFWDDASLGKFLTDEDRFGGTRFLFTELQFDQWTNYANNHNQRSQVVSGKTRFISTSGNDAATGLTATTPKRSVLSATNASNTNGNDIVVLAPGSYNEQLTITRPVTLRATRKGAVVIGATTPPSSATTVNEPVNELIQTTKTTPAHKAPPITEKK